MPIYFSLKGDEITDKMIKEFQPLLVESLTRSLTASGWENAQTRVSKFKFENTLYKGIHYRFHDSQGKFFGEIYIDQDRTMEFLVNEFGRKKKMKVTGKDLMRFPKLKRWYEGKGKGLGVKIPFTLGSSRGRQHYPDPKNKFWYPTFLYMTRKVNYFVEEKIRVYFDAIKV